MDLLKAFDCVKYGLLVKKLSAFGLNSDAFQIIISYLTKRKKRVKINSSYIS